MKNSSSYYGGQNSKQLGRKPSKEQISGQARVGYEAKQSYDTNKFIGHQHAPSYDRVASNKGRTGSAAKRYQNDVEPTTNQRSVTTKKHRPQSSKPVPSSAVTYASTSNV